MTNCELECIFIVFIMFSLSLIYIETPRLVFVGACVCIAIAIACLFAWPQSTSNSLERLGTERGGAAHTHTHTDNNNLFL